MGISDLECRSEGNMQCAGQWGYCPPDCQGETPTQDSTYNLAREEALWEGGLYDLREQFQNKPITKPKYFLILNIFPSEI